MNIIPQFKKITISESVIRTILYTFAISCVVFSYSAFQYLFGNHDWTYLTNPISAFAGLGSLRWGDSLLQQITFGMSLPVINHILFLFTLSIASYLTLSYWKLEKKIFIYVLIALLFVLSPNILTWLYYTCFMYPKGILFIVTCSALLVVEKKTKTAYIISICLFYFALSTYPVIVNTIALLIMGKIVFDSIEWRGSFTEVKMLFFKYLPLALCLLCSLLLLQITMKLFAVFGLLDTSNYFMQTVSADGLLSQILFTIKASFVHLWATQPYMPRSLKVMQIALLLLAFVSILYASAKNVEDGKPYKIAMKIGISAFLCLLLIPLCKINFFISDIGDIYEPRFAFFGYSLLYAFAGVAVYSYGKPILKKAGIVIICLVLWISVVQDFNAQKIWKMALDSEMMMYNRILMRIEKNPNYVPYKPYILVQFGNIPSMRQKYYTGSYDINSKELLYFSSNAYWKNGEGIEHISPDLKIAWSPDLYSYPRQAELIVPLMEKIKPALQNAKPWPAAESVQIIDNVILLSLDKNHLNQWQQAVAQLNTGIILFPPFNLDKNTQYALDITTDVYGVYKLTYLTADASPQVKSLTFQTSPQSFRVTLPKDIQGSFITLQEISNNGVVNITRLELTIL